MKPLEQVVHDIRNHVSNVISALRAMKHVQKEDKEYFDIAQGSLEKIEPYWELLEPKKAGDEVMGILSILTEVQNRVVKGLPSQISFVMDNKHCLDDFLVYCEPTILKQLVDNILDNAIKAQATKLIVTTIHTDCCAQLYFKDNGCGISEDGLDNMGFGHTTSGSGKGVEIIRALVSSIRGCVYWVSIEDIGSSCVVKLKRQKTGAQQ